MLAYSLNFTFCLSTLVKYQYSPTIRSSVMLSSNLPRKWNCCFWATYRSKQQRLGRREEQCWDQAKKIQDDVEVERRTKRKKRSDLLTFDRRMRRAELVNEWRWMDKNVTQRSLVLKPREEKRKWSPLVCKTIEIERHFSFVMVLILYMYIQFTVCAHRVIS